MSELGRELPLRSNEPVIVHATYCGMASNPKYVWVKIAGQAETVTAFADVVERAEQSEGAAPTWQDIFEMLPTVGVNIRTRQEIAQNIVAKFRGGTQQALPSPPDPKHAICAVQFSNGLTGWACSAPGCGFKTIDQNDMLEHAGSFVVKNVSPSLDGN